jgi:hypothetical protein
MLKQTNIAVILGLLIYSISAQSPVWTVQNRTILKDGEVFTVKGVNYAPLPPGATPSEATQWGDLFHADWAHLHDRDLPLMRAAGVNSMRIYAIQLNYPNSDQQLDHLSFFDKLWNNGVDPIYILITYAISTPWSYLGPFDTEPTTSSYKFKTFPDGKWYQIDDSKEAQNSETRQIQSNIVAVLAERYGNHPAVMGFVIGNEQNNQVTRSNCKFWEWIDSIGARIKWYSPDKLTTTTVVDDDFITVSEAIKCSDMSNLDVWGINAYRGRVDEGFGQLFDRYASLAEEALLITEFGCPSSTRDGADNLIMMPENSKDQGSYLKVHWDDMMAHSAICSGGYAFSWVDEWWKNGNLGIQDQHDARNYAFPGTYADEELFGFLAVEVDCDQIDQWATRRDRVLPRSIYYTMGQMFGAFSEIPDVAWEPINYPLCDGRWVGAEGAPNPDAGVPIGEQGPVASVPISNPPRGPEPMPVPVAVPVSTETPSSDTPAATPIDGESPSVAPIGGDSPSATPVDSNEPSTTPISVDTPSVIVRPPSANNNVQSSASVLAPVSLFIVAAALL